MSNYLLNKYRNTIWDNIWRDTSTARAYDFGLAEASLGFYKYFRDECGKEKADEIFLKYQNGNSRYVQYLRTMIELDNEETNTLAERLIEVLDKNKKKEVELTDDEIVLIQDFAEFMHQREKTERTSDNYRSN